MHELSAAIDRFLDAASTKERVVFVQRYFYALSVAEISDKTGLSQSNVKVILSRTRKELKAFLEQEGY